VNSFRRVVRSGVHQALEFEDGRDQGSGFHRCCELGEGRGEPLVELVRGWGLGGGRDEPVFKSISEAWPVSFLPGWPRFVVVGRGGA